VLTFLKSFIRGFKCNTRAVIYSVIVSVFIVYTPWENFTEKIFTDREIYIQRFTNELSIIQDQQIYSIKDFVLREALWDLIIRSLSDSLKVDPIIVLNLVSICSLFIFSFFLFTKFNTLLVFVFMFNPLIIDFGVSQIRNSFATSILLIASNVRSLNVRIALGCVATLRHSSSIVIIGLYLVSERLAKNVAINKISVISVIKYAFVFTLILFIFLGPFRGLVLGYLGDRRALNLTDQISLLYGSFWLFLLFFYLRQGRTYFSNAYNVYSLMIIFIFTFSYAYNIYGIRYISVSYPVIAYSIFGLKDKQVAISAYCIFATVQWYYWLT